MASGLALDESLAVVGLTFAVVLVAGLFSRIDAGLGQLVLEALLILPIFGFHTPILVR